MIRPDLTASKPPMLLLVDDIPENLKVIGKTLMGEGYDVIFASNGPKALELAANAMPNLILLDVQMPGMNGLEVCRLLKKDPRTSNIPVIFLTARNDTDDIILGFEAGGVDYITKPYNARELVLRIRNHTDLQLAREEVYQLNATKDKFFSIIAHDLRNPFQAMMGMSSLILDRLKFYDDEELKQIAGYMHKAAENGYELLQNLLGWAYTQMKKIQFTPTTINLKEAVDKCIEPIELQSVTKSISLKNNIDPLMEAYTDPSIFQTILRNLIINGIKYTGNGGEVYISAIENSDWVEVSVKDTGIGMDESMLADLFRLDKVRSSPGTDNETGTGLGLLLCKEFIRMYDGQIWVESAPGEGSCFTFTIRSKHKVFDI